MSGLTVACKLLLTYLLNRYTCVLLCFISKGYPVNDDVILWSSDPPSYTERYKHPDDGNATYHSHVADYSIGPYLAQHQAQQQLQHNTVILRQHEVAIWPSSHILHIYVKN